MNTKTHRSSIMKRLVISAGAAIITTLMLGGVASAAAPLDQITVQASRNLTVKHLGKSSSGIPIDEISLSVYVKTAGLDLATSSGLNAMEKRIHAAADSACREIGRLYPFAETSDAECAIVAARPAIAKVREVAVRTPTP